ncbi:hypothetical protein BY458DRAFT_517638 [Sporodiniella umbellata]|nr:hypothetical protein BY458DRAFT_517638 [Sporodiniella umbellata]
MSDLKRLLLKDVLASSIQAESMLECLTAAQIQKIEMTLSRVKRRKAKPDFYDKGPMSVCYSDGGVLKRYQVKVAIEDVVVDRMESGFKSKNCIYPGANVPLTEYQGHRWLYETECNVLGWKLAWVNQELVGQRGLIQRVVEDYRHQYLGTPSKRPKTMTFTSPQGKYRIKIALEEVLLDDISDEFRSRHCIFPHAMTPSYGKEFAINELAWKLVRSD